MLVASTLTTAQTSFNRVTEKERFEIKNPKIGTTVYQIDNQSGLYAYTKDAWESIPTTNKQLETLMACSKVTTVDLVSDLKDINCGSEIITTAIALGYHTKNDGGGGIFTYNPSLDNPNVDGEGDGGLVFDGWERTLIDRSINVKWFGARANVPGVPLNTPSDLVLDNNTAFKKALLAVEKSLQGGGTNSSNNNLYGNTATLGIFIPSGEYVIGANGLFNGIDNGSAPNDPNELDVVTRNITYFSDGNAILIFTNTGANEYAFRNDDVGSIITFRDITFVGISNTTNFIYSEGNNPTTVQDYYFDRCTFKGIFDRIFTVRGGANGSGLNNSEWGFLKCAFLAPTKAILDIDDSDSFTNYWFDQTKFWMSGNSKVLKAERGGHFKFVNCDWSGIEPTQETYLFELNDDDINYGVNDFRIINGRFEMKTPSARVMKSNWNSGNIDISADFGSQIFQPFFKDSINDTNSMNDIKHFEFNIRNNSSVNISFDNSVMMGYHEYNYTSNSFEGTARASYKNCSFIIRNKLDGFIRTPTNGHLNKSGISFIEIEDAIFKDLTLTANTDFRLEIPSVHYLPIYSNRGLKKKIFKIGHPGEGGNPINGERFVLNFPEEAESIITKVTWSLPSGAINDIRNARFVLEDSLGTDISYVSGGLINGYDKEDNIFLNVKDIAGGKLYLRNVFVTNGVRSPDFHCIIEYF